MSVFVSCVCVKVCVCVYEKKQIGIQKKDEYVLQEAEQKKKPTNRS